MSATAEPKTYRSPRHKLLTFFEKSRDRWKAKCLAAKRKAKALANDAAAVRRSRERWKALARQQSEEMEQLRQQLEEAKKSLP